MFILSCTQSEYLGISWHALSPGLFLCFNWRKTTFHFCVQKRAVRMVYSADYGWDTPVWVIQCYNLFCILSDIRWHAYKSFHSIFHAFRVTWHRFRRLELGFSVPFGNALFEIWEHQRRFCQERVQDIRADLLIWAWQWKLVQKANRKHNSNSFTSVILQQRKKLKGCAVTSKANSEIAISHFLFNAMNLKHPSQSGVVPGTRKYVV